MQRGRMKYEELCAMTSRKIRSRKKERKKERKRRRRRSRRKDDSSDLE